MYYNLAEKEEEALEKKFRKKYLKYKGKVPMFLPKLNFKKYKKILKNQFGLEHGQY